MRYNLVTLISETPLTEDLQHMKPGENLRDVVMREQE